MRYLAVLISLILSSGCRQPARDAAVLTGFAKAETNAPGMQEALRRSHDYAEAWLSHADPESGLIPTNLENKKNLWEPHNAAADNYAFLVLTSEFTDRELFEGRMRQMLESEKQRTSRLGPLPDVYSFETQDFQYEQIDFDRIAFGASEYIKDGLLPITEWLGTSDWSARMLDMLDALWENAPYDTPAGRLVSMNVEVNGEMLQTLSRIYWMTNDERYLAWALRLGDYYLLGNHHPTEHLTRLRLRDHGCEVVSGLTELYATLYFAKPEKYLAYREPIHRMLDRILEIGRNEHGLFHNLVDPTTGAVLPLRGDTLPENMADTFGYTFNGFYTVYRIDSTEVYREAIETALSNLSRHYRNYDWESGSADGYADAIEGALNLYNRMPLPSVAGWLDSEIRVMWDMQQPDGLIEGWHGDGNFARTSLMYALWKTRGLRVEPWRADLKLGAEQAGDTLFVYLAADDTWQGAILPDVPRHGERMHLPFDWPRINQFPEWYTVSAGERFAIIDFETGEESVTDAETLRAGIPLALDAGESRRIMIVRTGSDQNLEP